MGPEELSTLPLPERYIISKCHALTAEVTAGLEAYNMADAGQQIYQFLWDEYADWYARNFGATSFLLYTYTINDESCILTTNQPTIINQSTALALSLSSHLPLSRPPLPPHLTPLTSHLSPLTSFPLPVPP